MENSNSQKTGAPETPAIERPSFFGRQSDYWRNFPKRQKKLWTSVGVWFIRIGPRTANGIKNMFTKKLTPAALCKIIGFMIAAAWLLAGFATFAGAPPGQMFPGTEPPVPLYGSKILYGFGLVFVIIFIIVWSASLSAKATTRSRITSIALLLIAYVIGISFLPAPTTMWIGAAAGVFLFIVAVLQLHGVLPNQWFKRNAPVQTPAPKTAT